VDPIFLVGTERSGSNLLRLILDSHPNVHIPHPPHLVRYFHPLEPLYGDLSDDRRFRALVDDALRLVHCHIHPWPWVPGAEEIVARARSRDVFGVYVALHEAARDDAGKRRWGCKSTFMVAHLSRICETFPAARLVWLHRDVRDVAASARDSVLATFHPAYTARLWEAEQRLAWQGEQAGLPVHRVRYESLVAEPEATIRMLCDWIGEDFQPGMLEWFRGAEAKRSSELSTSWRNTASPMRTESVERWRRDLGADDLLAVEALAAPMMATLGYEPASAPAVLAAFRPGVWTRARWRGLNEAYRLRVEARSVLEDRNVAVRWRRAALLARIRIRRRIGG
jgi:hypothetical protein